MVPLRYVLSFVLLCLALACSAQPLPVRLHEAYPAYREPALGTLRFRQADILPSITALPAPFEVLEVGRSVEDRPLLMVRWGEGPIRVLLWSQMHGDEPTATMALLDIFRFLQASGDGFDELRASIRRGLTLYAIPMLNPDGAERFQRRNAYGIDLNRDALRLQSPEARALKRVRDQLEPTWGFNLHDQSRYYGAGATGRQAAISFLAPAYNEALDINPVRERAMRLIGVLTGALQPYLPDQMARYDDAFEPRAFGDNIQRWGTSTILIESGGLPDDPEKQRLRHLHFVALLTAFQAIADGSYAETSLTGYESLPLNDYGAYHDLLLRRVSAERMGQRYEIDVAWRRTPVELPEDGGYRYRGTITDLGDLSTQHAYRELASEGYRILPGKVYGPAIGSRRQLAGLDPVALLRQGYTEVLVEGWSPGAELADLPLRLHPAFDPAVQELRPGANPSVLLELEGSYRYAVVNGRLLDLRADADPLRAEWAAALR